jgi:cytochrome oxidase Cu insertion factor (SCO1/SenC/PrrC family)
MRLKLRHLVKALVHQALLLKLQNQAEPRVWSLLTLNSSDGLKSLLDSFGIYVIKVAPFGDLDHNASFHLIDPEGNLIKISSLDDADDLLSIVKIKIKHE